VQMGGARRTVSSLESWSFSLAGAFHAFELFGHSCWHVFREQSSVYGYGTVSPANRALFTTNSNCDKADTADQCDHAHNWWNRHSFLLFMADLDGARVDVFLFVCEGESSECEADNTDQDENYSYDGGGFHVCSFQDNLLI
jgi:hypothetical protein